MFQCGDDSPSNCNTHVVAPNLRLREKLARCQDRANTCHGIADISQRHVIAGRFRIRNFRRLQAAYWSTRSIDGCDLFGPILIIYTCICYDGCLCRLVMHYTLWYKFSVLLDCRSTCFSTFNRITLIAHLYIENKRCKPTSENVVRSITFGLKLEIPPEI